jgi:DNA-binding CsgD family transcriptional regulator
VIAALVERDSQLEGLREVAEHSARRGGLVFLFGESGHGKTSLIDAFLAGIDHRFGVIRTACEPLGRPLAFGPLLAAADVLPRLVRDELERGALRPVIYREMLHHLRSDPTILIVEDVQWSDEATLGLVRHLGRDIAATSSIVIVSVRPESIDPAHPFQVLAADIGRHALRLELPPLTPRGVRQMTRDTDLDPDAVHAATLGNPFFVEEIVRHPGSAIPATVSDTIAAVVAALPEDARDVLELVALTSDGIAVDWLGEDGVDIACQRRLVVVEGGRARCRHDLIRTTVERSIPPARRGRHHRSLVRMLEDDPTGLERIAELAYHSHEGGLRDEAARYAVAAGAAAAKAGSHREAARAYGWAHQHMASIPEAEVGRVLRAAAYEHLLVNDFAKAIEIAEASWELASDELQRAKADAWVAFFAIRFGSDGLAEDHAKAAVAVLRRHPASAALARAEAVLAQLPLARGMAADAISPAENAVATAREAGARAVEADALITLGTAMALEGIDRGLELIEEGAAIARELRSLDAAARAVYNLGKIPFSQMNLAEAAARMDEGLRYLASEELDAWYVAVETTRAHIWVIEGEWAASRDALDRVLPRSTCLSTEAEASLVAALRALRLGEDGALAELDAGLARADSGGDYPEKVMAAELAMEAAWLGLLDPGAAADRYTRMIDAAFTAGDGWSAGRLAFWALRLGFAPPARQVLGPVADELAGDPVKAARRWREAGYPVEACITEAFAEEAPLRELFSELDELGVDGAIAGLRRRLRERGVTGIPRGVQQATGSHPAGLTARQQDVLALLAAGLTNDAIAQELFISAKTVSHHVSAILAKLEVDTRGQAASVAHSRRWL